MVSLYELISEHPLHLRSRPPHALGNCTYSTPVNPSKVLALDESWRPTRYAHDPQLLDIIENYVKSELSQIEAPDKLVRKVAEKHLDNQRCWALDNEEAVLNFLTRNWLDIAEMIIQAYIQARAPNYTFTIEGPRPSKDYLPDIVCMLHQTDSNDKTIDSQIISLNEVKTQGMILTHWEQILRMGREQKVIEWDKPKGWRLCDHLAMKIAAYMAYNKIPWSCWTSAAHLLVFHLVREPGRKPYLVISNVVEVSNLEKPAINPVDPRIGERWMTMVIGSSLACIAASETGRSWHMGSIKEPSIKFIERPKCSPKRPGSSRAANAAAILYFSEEGLSDSSALAMPLTCQSPAKALSLSNTTNLPDEFCSLSRSGSIQRLVLDRNSIGAGSTGTVYAGRWNELPLAVKISETDETRKRLLKESRCYEQLSDKTQARDILPHFYGLYRHSLCDILVLSPEGKSLDSWDELCVDEKHQLLSMVKTLHQVGIKHGDVEPRNVLKSPSTGKLKLIDLSEASDHQCTASCTEIDALRKDLGLPHVDEVLRTRTQRHLSARPFQQYPSPRRSSLRLYSQLQPFSTRNRNTLPRVPCRHIHLPTAPRCGSVFYSRLVAPVFISAIMYNRFAR